MTGSMGPDNCAGLRKPLPDEPCTHDCRECERVRSCLMQESKIAGIDTEWTPDDEQALNDAFTPEPSKPSNTRTVWLSANTDQLDNLIDALTEVLRSLATLQGNVSDVTWDTLDAFLDKLKSARTN
jgi:hypothetical protein